MTPGAADLPARAESASAHLPGREVAKSVIFWMDGAMAMAVLPGSRMIDFTQLKNATSARDVEIAAEWHGVACVQYLIEHHALELSRVHENATHRPGAANAHPDAGAEQYAKHVRTF